MKYRYALLPLLLGLGFSSIGLLLRILHWPGAGWLRWAGLAGLAGGVAAGLLRWWRGPGAD